MQKVELCPEDISKVLSENIKNKNATFIFPTDVVMNSWIDWIVTHPTESGTEAVPFEQFIAWDNFKREFVSAHKEGLTAIPTILRKMFVTNFIQENNKSHLLKVIINPNYSEEADSFSDWLSKNLQTLHFWKKRLTEMENNNAHYVKDLEDEDYEILYNAYSNFLETNNLFEPSWVEDIDFSEDTKNFYLFYPELLEDFIDYENIFNKVPNITAYTLPSKLAKQDAYFYPDSRSELRQTMLSIIKLVNDKKADWSEIVLSVPNLDMYRPYIEREFDLYNIPYVIKAGVSLTINSAGRIFTEIRDCKDSNFSFDSVRALLLDEYIPWKDKYIKIKEDLIREGNKLRCICSVSNDTWIEAFTNKIRNLKNINANYEVSFYDDLLHFYKNIKNSILAFFPKEQENNNFENILTCWMKFKSLFLKDDNEFSEDANNILGRCITELKELIDIEKQYKDCNLYIPSPFNFYLQELNKKTYTKQNKASGVIVFPYKLSAAAYFKYQFVIDCSQKNLDVTYKRLTFLNSDKRTKLNLVQDDSNNRASDAFIALYGKNNDIVHFSASENTFNGYAIPHNSLNILTEIIDDKENYKLPNYDNYDYILQEKNYIINVNENHLQTPITQGQIDSFNSWKDTAIEQNEKEIVNEKIKDKIERTLITNRFGSEDNKYKFTATSDLKKFFPCPRNWLLANVLKLKDDTLDTNLMQNFDMGNLNHKVLEKFMKLFIDDDKRNIKKKYNRLPFFDENTEKFYIKNITEKDIDVEPESFDDEIKEILYGKDNIVEKSIMSFEDFRDSPLVLQTLLSQKETIGNTIESFLKILLLKYKSPNKNNELEKIRGIGNCIVEGVEAELVTSRNDYDYYGKIDCLVLNDREEKELVIIDYKNTESSIPQPKDFIVNENGILGDFQMPTYYNLVNKTKQNDVYAGYFYAINDGTSKQVTDTFDCENSTKKYENDLANNKKNVTKPVLDNGDENLFNSIEALHEYSDLLFENVKKYNFTPHQSLDKKDKMNVKNYKNCSECNFKSICRTTYNVGGKTINMLNNQNKILKEE